MDDHCAVRFGSPTFVMLEQPQAECQAYHVEHLLEQLIGPLMKVALGCPITAAGLTAIVVLLA